MTELKLLVASDATAPLSLLAVAGLNAVHPNPILTPPVLVLTNGCEIDFISSHTTIRYVAQTKRSDNLQYILYSLCCIDKQSEFHLISKISLPFQQQKLIICNIDSAKSFLDFYRTKLRGVNVLVRYLGRTSTTIPSLYQRDALETAQIDEYEEYASIFSIGSEYEGACKYVDGYLLHHTFLVGQSLSVADIVVWSYLAGKC
ncbi:putative glutamate--tRNA ligase [Helianthus annuus]|nr:putative glutamate--tRNA ligase [Helianthus annuus]